ncbi:VC0807 family protein [Streptomyces odontomachi]|uniref:VC0807 family protein n=1 Tax=Streptomyces odontomachi TaxID=2944940 RepID=UPI00210A1D18|nr:VC0807 family protein [Streptomyces sp. ODS25]
MAESPGAQRPAPAHGALSRVLTVHVLVPLVLFYGLRWLGVNQFLALLAGAVIPAAGAVRGLVAERRIGGLQVFMLLAMGLTVAMSFVTGSPRLLLIRNGWGMAAIGVWMLCTLLSRRPFLYEATRIVVDEDRRRMLEANWERHPAFRRLLWICSAFWGAACLLDSALRTVLAMTLPIDLVPVLDDALLAVTVLAILAFQRFFGRGYLRRHGLRSRGLVITPLAGTGRPA